MDDLERHRFDDIIDGLTYCSRCGYWDGCAQPECTPRYRHHLAKQNDGRGWMLLRLEALGAGWSTKATVVECNLPEETARARLVELRAAEPALGNPPAPGGPR